MYLRTSLLVLLLLSGITTSYAQTKDDLIGKWKVVAVEFPAVDANLPQENKDQLQALKAALQKAVFVFEAKGTCSLIIPFPPFQFENALWDYFPAQKRINIHEKGTPPGSLMGIYNIQYKDDTLFFQLDESPIKLRAKKS